MRPLLCLSALLLAAFAVEQAAAQPVDNLAPPAVLQAGAEPATMTVAMTGDEMEAASGGQGITVDVLTSQQLSGTTTGNTVTAGTLTSGDVSFSADALAGFSGVGNFVINTGANNTLQGAINISVVTAPVR